MNITTMDPMTEKLAVQMQLADIAELLDSLYDQEVTDDERTGLKILKRDLEGQLKTLQGQVLALRILKQEHENRVAFTKLIKEEKQAADDHRLALKLSGMKLSHPDSPSSKEAGATLVAVDDDADEQWESVKKVYDAIFGRNRGSGGRPAAKEVKKAPKVDASDTQHDLECVCCAGTFPENDTLTLSCEPEPHTYCRSCLTKLFQDSIHEDSIFPPRCCKVPIPIELSKSLLPKEMVKDFDLKVEEVATPNPTYCATFSCNKFILAKYIKNNVGTCPFCNEKTCTMCKNKSHDGLCPNDPHVQLLMDVAKRSKWQQCQRCKNMVELSIGCFHMRSVYNNSFALFAGC